MQLLRHDQSLSCSTGWNPNHQRLTGGLQRNSKPTLLKIEFCKMNEVREPIRQICELPIVYSYCGDYGGSGFTTETTRLAGRQRRRKVLVPTVTQPCSLEQSNKKRTLALFQVNPSFLQRWWLQSSPSFLVEGSQGIQRQSSSSRNFSNYIIKRIQHLAFKKHPLL